MYSLNQDIKLYNESLVKEVAYLSTSLRHSQSTVSTTDLANELASLRKEVDAIKLTTSRQIARNSQQKELHSA